MPIPLFSTQVVCPVHYPHSPSRASPTIHCCPPIWDKYVHHIKRGLFCIPSPCNILLVTLEVSLHRKVPLSRPFSMSRLKPLPDCEGPKLEAFTDDHFAAHDVEFLKALWSDTAHGNVFKTKIDGKVYAIKLVSRLIWFLPRRRLDLLTSVNSSSNLVRYGRMTSRSPLGIRLLNKRSRTTPIPSNANAALSVD